MRVRLKGINSVSKRLADGTTRTYWYAWKGGPPLRGEPGTPEFIHSYNEAAARKATGPQGTMLGLLQGYQQSAKFLDLGARTRSDYIKQIEAIENRFGDFPLAALSDRRTRGIFKQWRDQLALKSRRQADYAWQVLALILAFGLDRGLITHNPCTRAGRTLPQHAHRENLDERRRDGVSQIGPGASASAATARVVDRPAPGRSLAPAVVRLRRHTHTTEAIKDRRAHHYPGSCAAEGRSRRSQEAGAADPNKQLRTPVDVARLSSVMAHRGHKGGHCWAHISRSARHCRHTARDHGMHHTRDREV